MNISGASATGTASAVWTNATRTLTGLGGNALFFSTVTYTSIPASGAVIIQPTPTSATIYSIGIFAGAATGSNAYLYDGSNQIGIAAVGAGVQALLNVTVTNAVYLRIQNVDATNAAHYMASGITFHQ